jgi:hypothetical protein
MSDPLTDGVRRFRWPPLVPAELEPYQWSFLTPVQRMVADSQQRGMPLSQEQLRTITLNALTGGK